VDLRGSDVLTAGRKDLLCFPAKPEAFVPLVMPSVGRNGVSGCGRTMRIVSFIEDHKAIDKIIKHLKLSFKAARPPVIYFPKILTWNMI